jgi:hypothetical protein
MRERKRDEKAGQKKKTRKTKGKKNCFGGKTNAPL